MERLKQATVVAVEGAAQALVVAQGPRTQLRLSRQWMA